VGRLRVEVSHPSDKKQKRREDGAPRFLGWNYSELLARFGVRGGVTMGDDGFHEQQSLIRNSISSGDRDEYRF
jgi:hypothetical protein